MRGPGTACPSLLPARSARLRTAPTISAPSTLYAIGGLYGNIPALMSIRRRAETEESLSGTPVTLVFNGDFNFFNATPAWWRELNTEVSKHHATAGNVEVEMSTDAPPTGCGCGYPSYVSEGMVSRSDRIVAALWSAAAEAHAPELLRWVRDLPRALVAEVGPARTRVGIVHGDVDSLAGWQLGVEAMAPADEALRKVLGCDKASGEATHLPLTPHDRILDWCDASNVAGLCARTHACLMDS